MSSRPSLVEQGLESWIIGGVVSDSVLPAMWLYQRDQCSPTSATHESGSSTRPSTSASPHIVYRQHFFLRRRSRSDRLQRCRFSNFMSRRDALNCADVGCLISLSTLAFLTVMSTFRLISVRAAEGGGTRRPVIMTSMSEARVAMAVFGHARGFVGHREYRSTHDIGIAEFASLDALLRDRASMSSLAAGSGCRWEDPFTSRYHPCPVFCQDGPARSACRRSRRSGCPGCVAPQYFAAMGQAMSRPDKSATWKGRRGAASSSQKPPVN